MTTQNCAMRQKLRMAGFNLNLGLVKRFYCN